MEMFFYIVGLMLIMGVAASFSGMVQKGVIAHKEKEILDEIELRVEQLKALSGDGETKLLLPRTIGMKSYVLNMSGGNVTVSCAGLVKSRYLGIEGDVSVNGGEVVRLVKRGEVIRVAVG